MSFFKHITAGLLLVCFFAHLSGCASADPLKKVKEKINKIVFKYPNILDPLHRPEDAKVSRKLYALREIEFEKLRLIVAISQKDPEKFSELRSFIRGHLKNLLGRRGVDKKHGEQIQLLEELIRYQDRDVLEMLVNVYLNEPDEIIYCNGVETMPAIQASEILLSLTDVLHRYPLAKLAGSPSSKEGLYLFTGKDASGKAHSAQLFPSIVPRSGIPARESVSIGEVYDPLDWKVPLDVGDDGVTIHAKLWQHAGTHNKWIRRFWKNYYLEWEASNTDFDIPQWNKYIIPTWRVYTKRRDSLKSLWGKIIKGEYKPTFESPVNKGSAPR